MFKTFSSPNTHTCIPRDSKRTFPLSPWVEIELLLLNKSQWWTTGGILPGKRNLRFSMKFKALVKDRNVHVRMSGMTVSGFLRGWDLALIREVLQCARWGCHATVSEECGSSMWNNIKTIHTKWRSQLQNLIVLTLRLLTLFMKYFWELYHKMALFYFLFPVDLNLVSPHKTVVSGSPHVSYTRPAN